jgi:LL-diaminopimelate aminotransferase
MIKKAKRMNHLHTSVFTDLKQSKELFYKQTGLEPIDFSIGSPDIPPEEGIIETIAKKAADPANYKYAVTALPQMNASIQKWYKDRYGVDLKDEEIALLQGSQEALANLPLVFCDEGDGVLIPDPYYPIYAQAPALAQAQVLFMPLKEENDYLIDFDAIPEDERKKAKMMIVSYPNNPTGAIANDAFYEKLIQFAKDNEILVVHDNAYSELVFDGKEGKSFLSYPGAKEVGIELNSFSKTYGMAGARLGVLVGNEDVVKAYKELKSNMDYGIFLPVQYGGIEALENGGSSIDATRKSYEKRRDLVVEEFGQAGWKIKPSGATMFLWANVPQGKDDVEFAKELLEKTGIVVTPGSSFGKAGKGYVRIALVQNENQIKEAARRLKESGLFLKEE